MRVERIEISDLTPGHDDAGSPGAGGFEHGRRPARRAPRLLLAALACTLVAGLIGSQVVRAANLQRIQNDHQLTVVLESARPALHMSSAPDLATRAEVNVTLTLRVSVPVDIVAAELDGAPPVTRLKASSTATRTPSVTVTWGVLCAEVGTIPGPRLLDVDLRAQSGNEHRRVRIATTDTDPVSRVFRLTAAEECAPPNG